jgi:hypothetical protein
MIAKLFIASIALIIGAAVALTIRAFLEEIKDKNL